MWIFCCNHSWKNTTFRTSWQALLMLSISSIVLTLHPPHHHIQNPKHTIHTSTQKHIKTHTKSTQVRKACKEQRLQQKAGQNPKTLIGGTQQTEYLTWEMGSHKKTLTRCTEVVVVVVVGVKSTPPSFPPSLPFLFLCFFLSSSPSPHFPLQDVGFLATPRVGITVQP